MVCVTSKNLIQRPVTFAYDRTPNLPIDLAGVPAGPNDWVMGMIGRVLKVAAEEVGLEVFLKRKVTRSLRILSLLNDLSSTGESQP